MTPTLVWELAEGDRAGWIAGAVDGFGVVLPSAFPARARVLHEAVWVTPGDGSSAGWSERRTGRMPDAALAALLPHLAGATTTPRECTFAVWTGYGGMLRFGGVPHLALRHREYQLYRGALDDVLELSSAVYPPGSASTATPNIAWPRDGAWVLATEIDLDATYVAGGVGLVDAIAGEPLLESARA